MTPAEAKARLDAALADRMNRTASDAANPIPRNERALILLRAEPMTRQELAVALGVRAEEVTNTISSLRQQRKILATWVPKRPGTPGPRLVARWRAAS